MNKTKTVYTSNRYCIEDSIRYRGGVGGASKVVFGENGYYEMFGKKFNTPYVVHSGKATFSN